jgi:hypothetical protein
MPNIAIVGRPTWEINPVQPSFQVRHALVDDQPGVTRIASSSTIGEHSSSLLIPVDLTICRMNPHRRVKSVKPSKPTGSSSSWAAMV